MIQSDPMVNLDSRSWIPLDPSVIFGIGSRIPSDPWWNWCCRIYDLKNRGSKRIPCIYQGLTTLFMDKISTKSCDNACCVYISMKNCVNLLKKEHKRYVNFFCRRSDPYGSRHITESYISDPDGSLALLWRQIYDPSGSVGKLSKLWGSDLWSERIRNPDPWDQIQGSVFGIHGHVCLTPFFSFFWNLCVKRYRDNEHDEANTLFNRPVPSGVVASVMISYTYLPW